MTIVESDVFLNGIDRLEVEQQPGRYFVAHEYPEIEPDDYREHLQQALTPKYQAVFADKYFQLKHILPKICELILATDFGVYDISNPDKPNIFLELGIAIGMNKPAIITKSGNAQLEPQAPDRLPCGLQGLGYFAYQSYTQLRDEIDRRIGSYLTLSTAQPLTAASCIIGDRQCDFRADVTPNEAYLIATGPDDNEDFLLTVQAALGNYDLRSVCGGNRKDTEPTLCTLCKQVRQSRLGIYNISEPTNPHVFLQLGMAIGFCRPWLLVLRKGDPVVSDLAGYERVEFRSLAVLKNRLKGTVQQILESLEQEKVSYSGVRQSLTDLANKIAVQSGRLEARQPGEMVTMLGIVQEVRRHTTKKGEDMVSVTLEDLQGTYVVAVDPPTWSRTKHLWWTGNTLLINGIVDVIRQRQPIVVCDWVSTPLAPTHPKPGTIRVTLIRSGMQAKDVQTLRKIHSLLIGYQGQDRFVIHLSGGLSKPVEMVFPHERTDYCTELIQALTDTLGPHAVSWTPETET